jgi:hypothetical protein
VEGRGIGVDHAAVDAATLKFRSKQQPGGAGADDEDGGVCNHVRLIGSWTDELDADSQH